MKQINKKIDFSDNLKLLQELSTFIAARVLYIFKFQLYHDLHNS